MKRAKKSGTAQAVGRSGRTGCSARWWYTARVRNSAGMHSVFYGSTRPQVGKSCPGIAPPNKITGFWRESVPNASLDRPAASAGTVGGVVRP
jgi:hypothetical protein